MSLPLAAITDSLPASWDEEELAKLKADYPEMRGVYGDTSSKYNPHPGARSSAPWRRGRAARQPTQQGALVIFDQLPCPALLQAPAAPATCPCRPTTTPSTPRTRSMCR